MEWRATDTEPMTNTNIMPIFWRVFICSLITKGKGSTSITRSVRMLSVAVALNMDKTSMQEPSVMVTSQAFLIGLHAKSVAKNRVVQ